MTVIDICLDVCTIHMECCRDCPLQAQMQTTILVEGGGGGNSLIKERFDLLLCNCYRVSKTAIPQNIFIF